MREEEIESEEEETKAGRRESFTLCLVGGIIGRMENNGWKMVWKTVFSTVWEAKENREDGKSGRKFSSRTHQFFSSQIGRKTVERKLLLM